MRITSGKFCSTVIVVGGLCFASLVSATDVEFRYSGDEGPGYWSELNPEWGECAGTALDARQSPININRAKVDRNLNPLELQIFPTTVDIFNEGHTIEQRYEGTGSTITFEHNVYELQQFHFHTLSEHAIGGKRAAMELHAVFYEPGNGDYLVVGMLFKTGNKSNPFIQTLIDAGLPEKDGDTTVTDITVNLTDAFTNTSSYYVYPGSLTTPPCSETVTWVVLKKPTNLSRAQFESFRHILGNDFRPLQNLNDRVVRATRNDH